MSTHSEIKYEAENFFAEFLNRSPENYRGASEEELQDLLKFCCTSEECSQLEA